MNRHYSKTRALAKGEDKRSSSTVIKDFFLNLFFPRFCFGCQKEGSYLCQDCESTLEILEYHFCLCKKAVRLPKIGKCKKCSQKKLNGLYFALPYQNKLIQKLIHCFKYEPFIKELGKTLTSLIITHFQLTDNKPDFFYPVSPASNLGAGSNGADFLLIPVPLSKKRLKWRGFNQSEEIGKELSEFLEIPLINDVLFKTKEALPQIELDDEAREENVKGAFLLKNKEKIKGRKILLVDDVYTTGSTLEESARLLKAAGAKEVWGVTVARG